MNKLSISDIKKSLLIFLLWNPLLVLLLSNSYMFTAISSLIVFLLTLCVMIYCKKEYIKVVFFNIMCIVSIMGYVEVCFTYLHKDRVIPNLYESRENYYFNKPYLKEVFIDPEFTSTYITNCQGYRIGRNVNPRVPISDCDILFIGDSFTQGGQVDYEEMFSTIVQDSLQQYKVVNAGISGAGIFDTYYYFIDEGYKLSPKYVVLQLCAFNDFFNVGKREIGFKEKLVEHSNVYRYIRHNLYASDNSTIKRYTEPFFESKEDNVNYNIFFKETSDIKERDKRNLVKCLAALNEAVKTVGGELIVFLIPSKEQVSSECFQEVVDSYRLSTADLDMQYLNRWLAQETGLLNVPFIDLYQPFKDTNKFPYFTYDEHLNKSGHILVANELLKHFQNK